MNTEHNGRKKRRVFLLPVATALPVIAVLTFIMIRYGPTVRKLIGIMIKLAVTE